MFFREPMFEISRKWAYFRNGRLESILTTVPLRFGWGRSIGIAGVATRLASRGAGLGRELLTEVLRVSAIDGEGAALLFAKRTELYEATGFRVLDTVMRAPIRTTGAEVLPGVLSEAEVISTYERWAAQDPSRLRRDEQRWSYWKWNLRICCPLAGGYLCVEGPMVREAIYDGETGAWPLQQGSEWIGLTSMAERMRVPIDDGAFELYLMGHGFDKAPQMFMTDQF